MAHLNNTTLLWMLWFDRTNSTYLYIEPGESALIQENCEFLGYVPQKEMLQHRAELDIFQRMTAGESGKAPLQLV